MRKLSRSFFWIDQELMRSGIWSKMSASDRLSYVALAASVNREGLSLWGESKLINLAGVTEIEWTKSVSELVSLKLIELLVPGETGIKVLNFESDAVRNSEPTMKMAGIRTRPLLLRTTTTVEIEREDVESKDSK